MIRFSDVMLTALRRRSLNGEKETDTLKRLLGVVVATQAHVVKKKPKRRRIWLKDIPVGTTMTYPRREYKWNSVMANVYKHNKTYRKFSAHWDAENIYVTRIKP